MSQEGVIEQRLPGEFVRVELLGQVDAPQWWEVLLIGATAAVTTRNVYLGATGRDLVIVDTNIWGKPTDLRRIPLSQVKLVKCTEGLLTDDIVIDLGETKPLKVRVMAGKRQSTMQLASILSGVEAPAGTVATAVPSADGKSPPASRFWPLYLSGTAGAFAGHLAGFLLNTFLEGFLSPKGAAMYSALFVTAFCWVMLAGSLFVGFVAASLGKRLTRDNPDQAGKMAALLGFGILLAMWVLLTAMVALLPLVIG